MPVITIRYPTPQTVLVLGTAWYASVTTDKIVPLEAMIQETQTKAEVVSQVRQQNKADGANEPSVYHWILKFPPFTQRGVYTLTINPSKPGTGTEPQRRDLRADGAYAALDILSHQNSADIQNELMAFVAWGSLGSESLEYVRMTKSSGGDFDGQIREDWASETWSAKFLPLDGPTSGLTYTLRVKPYNGNEITRTGLIAG